VNRPLSLRNHLELARDEIQAMPQCKVRFIGDRLASVAAVQERMKDLQVLQSEEVIVAFDGWPKARSHSVDPSRLYRNAAIGRVKSACKMQYDPT
jgi:hypothetical protein